MGSDESTLRISADLTVSLEELRFQFSRSSGPGGQNVNRTATRVELLFDVARSPSLSDAQRAQIVKNLRSYIDTEGILHLVSQRTRSQWRNREDVVSRFQELVQRALRPRKARKPTHATRTAQERRLAQKRHRSGIKRQRRSAQNELE